MPQTTVRFATSLPTEEAEVLKVWFNNHLPELIAESLGIPDVTVSFGEPDEDNPVSPPFSFSVTTVAKDCPDCKIPSFGLDALRTAIHMAHPAYKDKFFQVVRLPFRQRAA